MKNQIKEFYTFPKLPRRNNDAEMIYYSYITATMSCATITIYNAIDPSRCAIFVRYRMPHYYDTLNVNPFRSIVIELIIRYVRIDVNSIT